MKRCMFAASLALAVVAVLGLASLAAAGEEVPLKGSLAGTDTGTPLDPPFVAVTVEAAGNATQLGNFTLIQLATVNTETRMGSGIFQFTAANGDTVFGAISGQATFTPPNVLSILEIATIEGGTGRFAGATGSFRVTRLKNTITGATIADFEGTISSQGP